MFELPITEMIIFLAVLGLYLTAALIGYLQLKSGSDKYLPLLTHLISIAVVLEAVFLIFRATVIKTIPLTGLFESMIVLTMVFGLLYLFLGMIIRQIWFSSVMVWVILVMIILTAVLARPAAKPSDIAAKPWAYAHGLSMILGEAMILLSAVSSYLYLVGSRRLKQKKLLKVIGIVPNLQKLEKTNALGLRLAFIFVTLGFFSGLGGAWIESDMLWSRWTHWLTEPKILGIGSIWLVLGLIILSHSLHWIRGRRLAFASILIFFLIFASMAASMVLGRGKHDFSSASQEPVSVVNMKQGIT